MLFDIESLQIFALYQPTASFTFLGDAFPTWLFVISCGESLGYGLGFSAFFFYLHAIAEGPNKTSMLAISSGLMGIGFTFPGAMAGWMQQFFGFPVVFTVATVIGLLALIFIRLVRIPTLDDTESGFATDKSPAAVVGTEE